MYSLPYYYHHHNHYHPDRYYHYYHHYHRRHYHNLCRYYHSHHCYHDLEYHLEYHHTRKEVASTLALTKLFIDHISRKSQKSQKLQSKVNSRRNIKTSDLSWNILISYLIVFWAWLGVVNHTYLKKLNQCVALILT